MLLVAVGVLLLEGAYVVLAALLLPRYLHEASRRAGLELTFAASRSWYPGSIRLQSPRLARPGAWSMGAEQLQLTLHDPWRVWDGFRVERAYASGLQGNWNDNHMGPLEARLHLGEAPADGPRGWISVHGSGAGLVLGAWSGQVDLEARAHLEGRADGEGDFKLNEGVVTAKAKDLRRAAAGLQDDEAGPTESAVVRMTLQSREGAFSREHGFSLRGRVAVAGDDAGIWLDLAGASSTVRWMLAELEETPFELDAAVRIQNGEIAAHQLRLEAGVSSARGGLYCTPEECRGALLVRRGAGSIGIVISKEGVGALLMPEPEWLSRELEHARERFERVD